MSAATRRLPDAGGPAGPFAVRVDPAQAADNRIATTAGLRFGIMVVVEVHPIRRTDLAVVPSKPRGFPTLENTLMLLYQPFSASFARTLARAAGTFLFVSGSALSASGQDPQTSPAPSTAPATARPPQAPPTPPSPVADGSPVSMDDAVRMALENNLGIQQERLNPQIQTLGVARANGAFKPELFTTISRRSSTAPPTDFLSTGGTNLAVTATNFASQAGVQQ